VALTAYSDRCCYEGVADLSVYVDPAAQGRGVGRLLAQACLDRAEATGRSRLVLHTTGAMAAAHALYRSLGFARTPERDMRTQGGLVLEAYVYEL
jgi:ribosomal protein S18 acetylase RimI-like enzyme